MPRILGIGDQLDHHSRLEPLPIVGPEHTPLRASPVRQHHLQRHSPVENPTSVMPGDDLSNPTVSGFDDPTLGAGVHDNAKPENDK